MDRRLRAELSRAVEAGAAGSEHAEVALGDGPLRKRLKSAMRALAEHRGPDRSTCPSDAARAVGGAQWRDLMPDAYAVARELATEGDVKITQRGRELDPHAQWRGPIRVQASGRPRRR